MLAERILETLRFFDLQDTPLTLVEISGFLLNDLNAIKNSQDNSCWEYAEGSASEQGRVSVGEVLGCLQDECRERARNTLGYYHLPGREGIVKLRLENYLYIFRRERRIRRFAGGMKHIPFVRGAALLGSQALGCAKPESDIDLLVVTKKEFLWLSRAAVSLYFQLLGMRRHGKKIANRFCLNHYVVEGLSLDADRNLYTASEYLKARSLVYPQAIKDFQNNNAQWIQIYFPNFRAEGGLEPQSRAQGLMEKLLNNFVGRGLESLLKKIQLTRIRKGEFIVANEMELSFHPNNRKQELFRSFFKF